MDQIKMGFDHLFILKTSLFLRCSGIRFPTFACSERYTGTCTFAYAVTMTVCYKLKYVSLGVMWL